MNQIQEKESTRKKTLSHIRAANSEPVQGPGNAEQVLVPVGRMHSPESVEQVERLLRGEGIVPTVRSRRTHFGLFVWRQDIARATQIFRQVQSECPEVERRGLRRDFDWFFLAMLVGFAPATVCLMQSRISRFSAFACLITAAGVGLVVELVRKNRVRNGTFQFRISDLAWFLSIVAAVTACWQAV